MFDCTEWDETDQGSELCDELFGDVSKSIQTTEISENTTKTDQQTRKQWKLKQKNKRKCKNKFRTKETKQEMEVKETCIETNKQSKSVKDATKEKEVPNPACPNVVQPIKKTKAGKRVAKPLNDGNPQSKKKVKSLTTQEKDNENKSSLKAKLNDGNTQSKKKVNNTTTQGKDIESKTTLKETKPTQNLKDRLVKKLESSRFRFINEQIYSQSSEATIKTFSSDQSAFEIYHRGFTAQVATWPVNPLDLIIKWIKEKSPKLVIADFGCGEAELAKRVKNKVHSFDLVAVNDQVTVADISNVPLTDASIDVVVFSLSLMGTNLVQFLIEANRVLKTSGVMKIAEVASRFTGLKPFIGDLKKLGFDLHKKNTSNTHFYMFDFIKTKTTSPNVAADELRGLKLKPCSYKKR
ncbi:ribosomal RNA-processing protein 8 [Ciona intestinalis]